MFKKRHSNVISGRRLQMAVLGGDAEGVLMHLEVESPHSTYRTMKDIRIVRNLIVTFTEKLT